ncbi:hypothetical protein CSOJ01_02319 [Colletotrichum sojae]|uniref:Uncharacterized protein n=1 Tax=Colletotrichum sojae TaxID=2175907 RepID=A0A8H6N265_9PEZI|nr:hypothetical protein CSOJ01_02319 [Colletotrichum sojae]
MIRRKADEPGLLLRARASKRVKAGEARREACGMVPANIISQLLQVVARVSRWQIQREAGVAALSSETRGGRFCAVFSPARLVANNCLFVCCPDFRVQQVMGQGPGLGPEWELAADETADASPPLPTLPYPCARLGNRQRKNLEAQRAGETERVQTFCNGGGREQSALQVCMPSSNGTRAGWRGVVWRGVGAAGRVIDGRVDDTGYWRLETEESRLGDWSLLTLFSRWSAPSDPIQDDARGLAGYGRGRGCGCGRDRHIGLGVPVPGATALL